MGRVNFEKATASSAMARASSRVSGAKLLRNAPPAMSASACLS